MDVAFLLTDGVRKKGQESSSFDSRREPTLVAGASAGSMPAIDFVPAV